MKKLLFITYFWPPSAKATLHWPLKIIKHLPENNWDPVVLTANEDPLDRDDSLLKEVSPNLKVVRAKTLEPFGLYKKFTGKDKNRPVVSSETVSKENRSITHLISIWIRMNIFVPDARVGWYFNAAAKGRKLLKEESFDAVISIGPPHSSHLTALKLSSEFNIPHVPILIDPWVDIIYYRDFRRSRLTLKVDNYFEKNVLQKAASVVFVTETTRDDYIRKYNFLKEKSHVLYWGYNEDDFAGLDSENPSEEILVHAGNIFDYQNPHFFWRRLKNEIDNGRNLSLRFIGTVSPLIKKEIIESGLFPFTKYLGFLPYRKMLEEINKASYLLVCASEKRHLPGKLFEYLRTGKPVIAFGDENTEVKKILEETNAGMIFRYDQDGKEFFENAGRFKTDFSKIKEFDREVIARKLAGILDKLKGAG